MREKGGCVEELLWILKVVFMPPFLLTYPRVIGKWLRHLSILQHAPVDRTAFVDARQAILWCSQIVLDIRGYKKAALSHFTTFGAVLSTAYIQAAMVLVPSFFHVLWITSPVCFSSFLLFNVELKVWQVFLPLRITVNENVFCPFASYLRLRYGSPEGTMDYVPACSILRTNK